MLGTKERLLNGFEYYYVNIGVSDLFPPRKFFWTNACTKSELIFGGHTGQVKGSDQDMSLDVLLSQKGENSTQTV